MAKFYYILILLIATELLGCKQSSKERTMVQIPQEIFYIPENTIQQSSQENGIDQLYFGKLELSESELKSFVEKNGLVEIQNKKDKPFFNEDHSDINWWNPDGIEIEFAGTKQEGDWVKEVLVSKNETRYIVFFRVYSI